MMDQIDHWEQLFYRLDLEDYVSEDHLLRQVGRFVDVSALRAEPSALDSHTGRRSIDPQLMIGMLVMGYLYGIRSEVSDLRHTI